ncbi:MAG: acylneuraminate cytidylyltransferase family protein [Phycisphaerales bacterium]|nr:acylneuraminate cytidylyltransferase family protein [Phycisphaerales bacterium]
MKPTVTAIVPMRNDSLRVPGKNWRPLAGRPLFCHIVDSLYASGAVNHVVIDTDSDTIRQIAKREFPKATLLARPEDLRDDRLSMNEVLLNTVQQVDGDVFLQTHSTNPMLRPQTIADLIQRFIDKRDNYDSLFTVTALQQRLWDAFARPVNHDPAVLRRTQDLSPVFAENSCVYLFNRRSLTAYRNRIGGKPIMAELERDESWDIDTEADFNIAEMMMQARALANPMKTKVAA